MKIDKSPEALTKKNLRVAIEEAERNYFSEQLSLRYIFRGDRERWDDENHLYLPYATREWNNPNFFLIEWFDFLSFLPMMTKDVTYAWLYCGMLLQIKLRNALERIFLVFDRQTKRFSWINCCLNWTQKKLPFFIHRQSICMIVQSRKFSSTLTINFWRFVSIMQITILDFCFCQVKMMKVKIGGKKWERNPRGGILFFCECNFSRGWTWKY